MELMRVGRHTFKLLPIIGKYVVALVEGTLQDDMRSAWRWRSGSGDARRSTRRGRAEDLADHPGWRHDVDGMKKGGEGGTRVLVRGDALRILAAAVGVTICVLGAMELLRR